MWWNRRPYWRSSIRYLLLIRNGNMSILSTPSSSPCRFYKRYLHICKAIWQITYFVYVKEYIICVFMKCLVIMTKKSTLSYYWICDALIIQWFSCFPNVSYWRGGIVPTRQQGSPPTLQVGLSSCLFKFKRPIMDMEVSYIQVLAFLLHMLKYNLLRNNKNKIKWLHWSNSYSNSNRDTWDMNRRFELIWTP